MKWLKLSIKTITAAEDIIIANLCDIGLEGAQIEDNQALTPLEKEQMFVDIMPDGPEDDGLASLNFFAALNEDETVTLSGEKISIALLIEKVEKELNNLRLFLDIGEGKITTSETAGLDWINNWKQYFRSFMIDDILVVPTWEEAAPGKNVKYTLRIDPGGAFGTGMHETTQLCIRQLRKNLTQGSLILDIGCGSGILAILSLIFGASRAFGTDLDPTVCAAVKENCRANNISDEDIKVISGNIITDEEVFNEAARWAGGEASYDIVMANILAEVLIPLTPAAYRCLKKGGLYITSGIINDSGNKPSKEDKIKAALNESGFEIIEINYQGDWLSISARK